MARPAIVAEGIRKSFGDVMALDGVDLSVDPGTVLGMLGPNGAGKTTMVRILTTLLLPDAGRAEVAGFDVQRDAARLRSAIGLAGQYAAVDANLTGRENLELVGQLYHLSKEDRRRRAQEVLERFGLASAAHRTVRTYSGGMRRRLDLGASLVGRPQVLFLDEPTTGLDPRSRVALWETIEEMVKDGTTLLLTTQYMEEADQLADRIVVIDGGRVIAEGTAEELKDKVGGEVLEFRVLDRSRIPDVPVLLDGLGSGAQVEEQSGTVRLPVGADGTSILLELVRRVDAGGLRISEVALRRPTLDDVFMALTGHGAIEDGATEDEDGLGRDRGTREAVSP
jgi:ABC-2 type transport system ATP-binding protein